MDAKPLRDKVAIVTGAGRGIGRSVALALARSGAHVSLAARTRSEIEAVRTEIVAHGGRGLVAPTDVSREADVAALVEATVREFGRLDILVNNAGIGIYGSLEQTTADHWDQVMAVNARGPFLLCRHAIPHLRRQKRSFIVNVSSVVGVKGYVNQAAYTASKHALLGMTKVLAKEVQPDGIRVHAICPGGVDTELLSRARPDLDRAVLIQPEEIADIVLFLLTHEGNAVIDQIDVRRAVSPPWS